jgi:hypothetical protein
VSFGGENMKAKKAKILRFKEEFVDNVYEDIYDMEQLDDYMDGDMISAEEQGFMMGYLGDTYV